MLAVLRIQNLAIIEESEIEFGPGLNVLTGETGAGKSIILKAIDLLSGRRASADIVRAKAEKCIVEGLFTLSPETQELIAEHYEELIDITTDDELIIKRIIDKSGRSKVYLNGSLTTAGILQRLASHLIDITGQNQQQTLLVPAMHLSLLDAYGVSEKLRQEVFENYRSFNKAEKELDLFLNNSRERTFYFERISAELEELNKASLEANERQNLEDELRRLANFESLQSSASECLKLLEEGSASALDQLREVTDILEKAEKDDSTLTETTKLAESAALQANEVAIFLTDYLASLDAEPERLEELRSRIAEIAALERKYQKSSAEIILYQEQIAGEVSEFEAGGLDEKVLKEKLEKARSALSEVEDKLTEERKKVAKKLGKEVEKSLAELNMKKARFSVEVEAAPSSKTGANSVAFTIAANPGEPFRAINKVASGGELSRLLLVLKTLLNQKSMPNTQIFDEIDSGIGGAVAQVVGERLRAISKSCQVILITHAPQIAALAEHHFSISKSSSKTSTTSTVNRLDKKARVGEIAGMLAGKEVSKKFEDSAKELLKL